MEIIRQSSPDLSKSVIFKCTLSPSIQKMSDAVGEILPVDSWVLYKDADKKDPEQENTILGVMCDDGTVRATNSKTFQEMFESIVYIMDGEPLVVQVVEGVSKAGRKFISCDMP